MKLFDMNPLFIRNLSHERTVARFKLAEAKLRIIFTSEMLHTSRESAACLMAEITLALMLDDNNLCVSASTSEHFSEREFVEILCLVDDQNCF